MINAREARGRTGETTIGKRRVVVAQSFSETWTATVGDVNVTLSQSDWLRDVNKTSILIVAAEKERQTDEGCVQKSRL